MHWIVNRREVEQEVDVRTSLLDLLREHLHLFGAKKGLLLEAGEIIRTPASS